MMEPIDTSVEDLPDAMPKTEAANAETAAPAQAAYPDPVDADPFWQKLAAAPYNADLFAVLRWVDSRRKKGPRLGRASRPHFDPIRLGQEPTLAFAPSTIANVVQDGSGRPRLNIYSFGLFGPNGPLPLHLTEYTRDRVRRFNDTTLIRFADIFHHRLILLFYRAWADAQPTVNMDLEEADRFTNYVASLIGYGQPGMRKRDVIADHAKLFHAPHLVRQTRNPEGLAKILAGYLKVPVEVEEFISHWISLTTSEQTRLTAFNGNNRLGEDTVLGDRVLDAQHKIRLRIGPMPYERYRQMLPGGISIKQIQAWIKNYVGIEFIVDLQLVLQKDEVPKAQLGSSSQLGWTTWLGERPSARHADDLTINCAL
jgi:type VI secretion system protein ImpH